MSNKPRKLSAYERDTFTKLLDLVRTSEDWGWERDQGWGSRVDASAKRQAQANETMLKRLEDLLRMRRELHALRKEVRRLRTTKGFID